MVGHVLDIYAASARPIEGVPSAALVDRMRNFGHRCVEYTGTVERSADAVVQNAREKDLVLTLGAGNVWQVGDLVLEKLREAA